MPNLPNFRLLALCALGLGFGTPPSLSIETAGKLLVELDSTDFINGSDFWKQHQPGTGIPGGFVPRGSPTRQIIGGAPAILFDGDGDYFVGPATTPSLDAPAAPHTVEIWAYQGNVRPQESIVSWGKRWGPDGTFASFRYGSDPDFGACGRWGSLDLGYTNVPDPGSWHHLVFTYDGSSQLIYVDGTLDAQKKVGLLDADDSLPIRIGVELRGDLEFEGQFSQFSGALARLRIHSGVLTPEQVAANHLEERPSFPGTTAAELITQPLHRFSFDHPKGPAPNGTVVTDTIGGLIATVLGEGASFTGSGLQLPGGNSNHAAYLDLPNGIVSRNESITLEFWAAQTAPRPWSRIMMIGDTSQGEITQPGGDFTGHEALALFGNVAATPVNRFTRSIGSYPNGGPDRDTAEYPPSELNVIFHHVICYDLQLAEWRWYRDGILMESIPDRDGPARLSDINVWIGRSEFSTDNSWEGHIDEFRVYNRTLSESEILGSFQAGPDLILPAASRSHLLWNPTAEGTYLFNDSENQQPWGADRGHPNDIGATATFATALEGDQKITLTSPITLSALNIGASNSGGRYTIQSRAKGSINLAAVAGSIATVTQLPGSFGDELDTSLIITSPTTVTNLAQTPLHISGLIEGDETLTKTGPGDLILTRDSPKFSGVTRIVQGSIVIGDDGDSGSLPLSLFEISESGNLTFDRADQLTLALQARGEGSIIHRGIGSLFLAPESLLTHSGQIRTLDASGPFSSRGTIDGPASIELNSPTTFAGSSVTRIRDRLAIGTESNGSLTFCDLSQLEFSHTGELVIGDTPRRDSSLFFEGGTIRCKILNVAGNPDTSGVIVQTGGSIETLTGDDESRIGGSVSGPMDSWGAWLLHGGSARFDWNLQIGTFGLGLLEIDGGHLECRGFLSIARSRNDNGRPSYGVVDVKSGSLQASASDRWLLVGEEGIGVMNIRGYGKVDCANALTIGAGTLDRPGHGTVNLLKGGILTVASINQFSQSEAKGILNFNGGTLAAHRSNSNFISGIDAIYLHADGGTIDTAKCNVAIELPIQEPRGMGVAAIPLIDGGSHYVGAPLINITGGGGSGATAVADLVNGSIHNITVTNPGIGYTSPPRVEILGGGEGRGLTIGALHLEPNRSGTLSKTGKGSLSLNSPSTFTGGIDVKNGTLEINGDMNEATGPILIANRASISGRGTLGGDLRIAGQFVVPITTESLVPLTIKGDLKIDNASLVITLPEEGLNSPNYVFATYKSLTGRFNEASILPAGYTLDYRYNGTNQIALVRREEP